MQPTKTNVEQVAKTTDDQSTSALSNGKLKTPQYNCNNPSG